MLSLAITRLHGIIPKLTALQKGLRICLTRNKEDWDLVLPYITMGYKMSKHVYLSHFSPYFLLFGRHPIPPSSIATQMDRVVDLDSPVAWARVIAKKVALFRRVMHMAMENLSIAQHQGDRKWPIIHEHGKLVVETICCPLASNIYFKKMTT